MERHSAKQATAIYNTMEPDIDRTLRRRHTLMFAHGPMTDSGPRPNRRDFLSGEAARAAMEHALDRELPAPATDGAAIARHTERSLLVRIEAPAMACNFEVILNDRQDAASQEAALECLDHVAKLESQLTVYRDSSEVSQLNRTAHRGWCQVEPQLFALLQRAHQIHQTTSGAFDITSGPLSDVWGFSRRQGSVPERQTLSAALDKVGSTAIEFDETQTAIRFAKPGLQINLGGIGKGYALDRCVAIMEQCEVRDYLLQGGQSSVLARGRRRGIPDGWRVAIRHPQRTEQVLMQLTLVNQAIGTSGTATQSFYHQGRRYGHILDPRTGWPPESDLLSVTAIAPHAADADALATAFYILGTEQASTICDALPGVGAVLVHPSRSAGRVVANVFGLDPAQYTVCHPSVDVRA